MINAQKTIKNKVRHENALCLSLLLYAEKDRLFSEELKNTVRIFLKDEYPKGGGFDYDDLNPLILMPKDRSSAVKRAWWLIDSEFQEAKGMLSAFARDEFLERPQERQLVVGVVRIAIPGITLGRLKIRKEMIIVIRKDIAGDLNIELAGKINQAGSGLLSEAIKRANNNIGRLEPEMGDWLFGDKETAFYSSGKEGMDDIKEDLGRLDIASFEVKDEKGTAVLAISPAVNQEYSNWPVAPLS